MLVSCDNAHAVHPNHAEKCDARNQVVLNGGIVIKEAANQHYCTDAFSRAVFQAICDDADVLDSALRVYQGRALYEGALDESALLPLCDKYGLII